MSQENAANGPADSDRQQSRTSLVGLDALHQAAMHLADARKGGTRLRTREIVALLLCHAARSRRASLDRAVIRLKAHSPEGMPAVTIVV